MAEALIHVLEMIHVDDKGRDYLVQCAEPTTTHGF